MSSEPLSLPNRLSRQAPAARRLEQGTGPWSTPVFLEGMRSGLLVIGGLLLVAFIALLDYATGPYLSVSVFYFIPVAVCAWWGGFSHGILVSLGGAVAWHLIDGLENPAIAPFLQVCNGVLRFGILVLTSSLVSRLRAGVLRERLLARTDALTGAANGRTFYEVATAEAERALRTGRPLTLAYFDVDDFKQLNDRLGHAAGDAALVHLVSTVRPHLRRMDLLARLGGDEFALLLPETDAEGAVRLLARLQDLVSQELARKVWPATLSVGAITFPQPLLDVDLMIQRVDLLMYGAKRKGKGRIEHTVLQQPSEPHARAKRWMEKRATARALCNREARLRQQEEGTEEFVTVCDISTGGIGLDLAKPLPCDTLLVIEPLSAGARTLLARVVRVTPGGKGWLHGCELSLPLSAEEMRGWLGDAPLPQPISPAAKNDA
jgi:diguanylate cyclase (GGDEF)-like protein